MDLRPIELHPEAILESRAARQWYEDRSPDAGAAFTSELDTAIDRISDDPDRHAAYLHGTRCYLFKRFPYLVVYRVTTERIQVLAIAHGRRRPGYWHRRLKSQQQQ